MSHPSSDESPVLKQISLQIRADPHASEQVLSWFEDLNQPPLPDKMVWWQCQTALKEGFDNVIDYAHQSLPADTPIDLEAIRLPNSIEIRIWDYGPPFNLQAQLEAMTELEDNETSHGRGLKIMQKIADHLSYERTEEGRNCLLIIKYY